MREFRHASANTNFQPNINRCMHINPSFTDARKLHGEMPSVIVRSDSLRSALTARCCERLIYRISFLFSSFGHALFFSLIKGSGRDVVAKGRGDESDGLLHEIDNALRVGKGFLLEQGALAILHALRNFAL